NQRPGHAKGERCCAKSAIQAVQLIAYAMRKNIAIREFLSCARFNANNLASSAMRSSARISPCNTSTSFARDAYEAACSVLKSTQDHGSVWASTERTAGRSRTIGFQVSPASDDP